MFARSAAADTLQGKAIQSVNVKWGTDVLSRSGRETIGIPVCKKKYRPFAFQIVQDRDDSDDNTDGKVKVTVERLYACQCHHPQRKAVIEQYGVRQGWQPFGVWSLRKAQEQARLETLRMNGGKKNSSDSVSYSSNNNDSKLSKSTSNADDSTDDDDNNNDVDFSDFSNGSSVNAHAVRKSLSSICLNGRCTWKFASAYDNIYKEIHGHTESEAEDNVG